jgi:AraC-like DNA-binding protein
MRPDLFLTYRPPGVLGQFVDRLWYWDGPQLAHARDRILPSGCAGLVINLAEDEVRDYVGADNTVVERHRGAVLAGAYSKYTVIDTREQRAVLGIAFTPGGARPFFQPAADELAGSHLSLGDLWGDRGATLRARILETATPQARLQLVERELLLNLTRPLQRRPEVDFLLRELAAQPQRSVAELSRQSGLSDRRVSRLFALETGLTPKRYARIKRFEQVLRHMALAKADWSELAQRCGYFDQAHLIHECRKLAGYTPAELAARRIGDTRHIPL